MRWLLLICVLFAGITQGSVPRDPDRDRSIRIIPAPPVINLATTPKLNTPTVELNGSEYVVTLTGIIDTDQSVMYYWRLRSSTSTWDENISWYAWNHGTLYYSPSDTVSFTATVMDTLDSGTLTKPWYVQIMVVCKSGSSAKSSWALLPWDFQ